MMWKIFCGIVAVVVVAAIGLGAFFWGRSSRQPEVDEAKAETERIKSDKDASDKKYQADMAALQAQSASNKQKADNVQAVCQQQQNQLATRIGEDMTSTEDTTPTEDTPLLANEPTVIEEDDNETFTP